MPTTPIPTPRGVVRLLAVLIFALTVLVASGASAQQQEVEAQRQFIEMMSDYLELSSKMVEVAENRHAAVQLSIEQIAEYYKGRGEGAKAIEHLQRLLAETSDRPARNLLHMKLAELMSDYGRQAEALEMLEALFKENSRG